MCGVRCSEASTDEDAVDASEVTRGLDKAIVSTPSSAKYCAYSRDCSSKSSSSLALPSGVMLFQDFAIEAALSGLLRQRNFITSSKIRCAFSHLEITAQPIGSHSTRDRINSP